jgi:hypothetical protein
MHCELRLKKSRVRVQLRCSPNPEILSFAPYSFLHFTLVQTGGTESK